MYIRTCARGFTDGSHITSTGAHTHTELIREWLRRGGRLWADNALAEGTRGVASCSTGERLGLKVLCSY